MFAVFRVKEMPAVHDICSVHYKQVDSLDTCKTWLFQFNAGNIYGRRWKMR